jgi:hypothetical protein
MITAADSNPPLELYCPTCEETFDAGELCRIDGTRLVRLGAQVDPFVGANLDGRYTILDKLGAGGMGAVYRAKQHSVGREVAIKVVNSNLTSDPLAVKRFLREAKLASRLAHPNVVAVLDFGQTREGVFYLVMELIEGQTLHAALQLEGPFDANRIVRVATQVCDALEGAHRLPIIHRDLKPANIMLLASGRDLVKVLDFGLAKSLSTENTSTTMTSAGAVLGTPAFMPPEIANGDPHDERADFYSLGCILFAMGTGRPPFVTDSVPEMIAMHACEPPPRMTGVPQPLADVVDRLLAKRPEDRYRSAGELRAAIEAAHDASRGMAPIPHGEPRRGLSRQALARTSVAESQHLTKQGQTAVYLGPPIALTLPPAPSLPAPAMPAAGVPASTQPIRARRRWWLAPVLVGLVGAIIGLGMLAEERSPNDRETPAAPAAISAPKPTVEPIIDRGPATAPVAEPTITHEPEAPAATSDEPPKRRIKSTHGTARATQTPPPSTSAAPSDAGEPPPPF